MRLTDLAIRNAKPQDKPYKLADGGNLFLLVRPTGRKWWRYGISMKRLLIILIGLFMSLSAVVSSASEEEIAPINPSDLSEMLQSAEEGDPVAQFNLGYLYLEGQAVPENYAEALKWLRKAAKRGNANAQTHLGIMYSDGLGVQKNLDIATEWYRKAAAQGDESARNLLELAIPDACHSDEQCVLIYSCADAAINKNHIDKFNATVCRQTSEHNPNATARCLNGKCQAVVFSCHHDSECAVAWGECGDRAVKKENMSLMQPAVRSCLKTIIPHNANTVARCIAGNCSLSK